MKKFFKFVIIIVLLYVLVLGATFGVAYAVTVGEIDKYVELQEENLQKLRTAYSTGLAEKIDEKEFCDFDLESTLDNNIKLNELRYIATHNSYKIGLNKASKFLFNGLLFQNGIFNYSFPTLTEQLNQGIRSIELDLNMLKDKGESSLICSHNPTLDVASSAIKIESALTELKLWSDYNPNHLPVIVLVEPKTGIPLTNSPDIPYEQLVYFDNLLKDTFGNKLLKPSNLIGKNKDFEELRKNNGYPYLKDTLGKFIFIMHESKYNEDYISIDKDYETQSMFLAVKEKTFRKHPEYKKLTLFAIANDPKESELINDYIKKDNFIVRTRGDENLKLVKADWNKAIISNANIVSTDFIKSQSKEYLSFNFKTIALRDINNHY